MSDAPSTWADWPHGDPMTDPQEDTSTTTPAVDVPVGERLTVRDDGSALDFTPTEIDPMAADMMARERWGVLLDGVKVTVEDGKIAIRPHPSIAAHHQAAITRLERERDEAREEKWEESEALLRLSGEMDDLVARHSALVEAAKRTADAIIAHQRGMDDFYDGQGDWDSVWNAGHWLRTALDAIQQGET